MYPSNIQKRDVCRSKREREREIKREIKSEKEEIADRLGMGRQGKRDESQL